MKRYRWLLRLVGVVLLLLILRFLDIEATLRVLTRANLWYLGFAVVLVVPHLVSKSWRWQVLVRSLGINIDLIEATRLYAIGQAAGVLTPGQAGDAVKAVYLRAEGHSLGRALVTVVVDRLFDLLVVGGLALWGVFVVGQVPAGQMVMVVLLVVAIVVLFMIFSSRSWQRPAAQAIRRLVPGRFLRGRDPQAVFEGLTLPRRVLLSAFGITIVSFVVSYFRSWLLYAALGLFVPLDWFLAATSIAGIAAILPVTVGGVGTRDAAFVVMFATVGYSPESAVALSTLVLLLLVTNWLVGFVAFMWRPGAASEAIAEGTVKASGRR